MGVKGLMTYVLSDNSSLKPYKLRKTKVIIDGNNLLYSIHDCHNVMWQFGGEYDKFDRAVVKFFERFKLCEIEPIVIFDGCYDIDGSKFKTIMSRFQDRIKTCANLNRKLATGGYLLPMLSLQTMIAVLKRLNIQYLTCPLEADKEAAALANHFGCPVISNDSDFFVFPLTCGFLPVSNVDFLPVLEDCQCCAPRTSHYFMACSIFRQSDMRLRSPVTQHASCGPSASSDCSAIQVVNAQFMPLLATLIGNDLIDFHFYQLIFPCVNTKINKNKKNPSFKSSKKIGAVLNWLHQFDSIDAALDAVFSLLSWKRDRLRLESIVKLSISQYDLTLATLPSTKMDDKGYHDVVDGGDGSNLGNLIRLPERLRRLLSQSILHSSLIDSVLSGNVILSTCVESIGDRSIHWISSRIRDRIYRILTSFIRNNNNNIDNIEKIDNDNEKINNEDRSDSDKINNDNNNDNRYSTPRTIWEYMRKERNVFKRKIDTNQLLSGNYDDITNEPFPRTVTDNGESFVKTMLLYWVKFSDKTILNCRQTLAVIAAVFTQLSWQRESFRPGSRFKKERHEHRHNRFFAEPTINNAHHFQIHFIHSYNELQSVFFCLVQFYAVTGVFGDGCDGLVPPCPQTLFCGRLCYNFCQDFSRRKNVWRYARQLFDWFPCDSVQSAFLDVVRDVRKVWLEFDSFISKEEQGVVAEKVMD